MKVICTNWSRELPFNESNFLTGDWFIDTECPNALCLVVCWNSPTEAQVLKLTDEDSHIAYLHTTVERKCIRVEKEDIKILYKI